MGYCEREVDTVSEVIVRVVCMTSLFRICCDGVDKKREGARQSVSHDK